MNNLMITQEQYKNHDKLIEAIRMGWTQQIPNLINLTIPDMHDSLAFREAAKEGQLKSLKLLLNVSNPKALNSKALELAIKNNHFECVQFLLSVCDVSYFKNMKYSSLDLAAINGNPDILKLLIPYFKKEKEFSRAMGCAGHLDSPECVSLLIEYVDVEKIEQHFLEQYSEPCRIFIESYKIQKTLKKNLPKSNDNLNKNKPKI